MSDLDERPEEAVTIAASAEDAHDLTVYNTVQYMAPIDGTEDQFAAADEAIRKTVSDVLRRHYFGYPWHTMSEIRQGIVAFNIPPLTGQTLHAVIVLKAFPDLTEDLIVRVAGNLLERMGLRRGPMIWADYVVALANKHKFQFEDVKH